MFFVEEPGDTFVPNTVICITKKVGDKKIFGHLMDINDECQMPVQCITVMVINGMVFDYVIELECILIW